MILFHLYVMAVVLNPIVILAAQTRFVLEIHNVSCQILSNHVKHFECDLAKLGKGRFLFNAKIMYDRKVSKDGELHIQLRIKPWMAKQSLNFIDLTDNACLATSQVISNALLRNLIGELIRSSNLPLDCSYKANFMYKVENYSLATELIPAYAPNLDGTFSIDYLEKAQKQWSLVVYAALLPKGKD